MKSINECDEAYELWWWWKFFIVNRFVVCRIFIFRKIIERNWVRYIIWTLTHPLSTGRICKNVWVCSSHRCYKYIVIYGNHIVFDWKNQRRFWMLHSSLIGMHSDWRQHIHTCTHIQKRRWMNKKIHQKNFPCSDNDEKMMAIRLTKKL